MCVFLIIQVNKSKFYCYYFKYCFILLLQSMMFHKTFFFLFQEYLKLLDFFFIVIIPESW